MDPWQALVRTLSETVLVPQVSPEFWYAAIIAGLFMFLAAMASSGNADTKSRCMVICFAVYARLAKAPGRLIFMPGWAVDLADNRGQSSDVLRVQVFHLLGHHGDIPLLCNK